MRKFKVKFVVVNKGRDLGLHPSFDFPLFVSVDTNINPVVDGQVLPPGLAVGADLCELGLVNLKVVAVQRAIMIEEQRDPCCKCVAESVLSQFVGKEQDKLLKKFTHNSQVLFPS